MPEADLPPISSIHRHLHDPLATPPLPHHKLVCYIVKQNNNNNNNNQQFLIGSDVACKFQDMGEFTLLSINCVSVMFYV